MTKKDDKVAEISEILSHLQVDMNSSVVSEHHFKLLLLQINQQILLEMLEKHMPGFKVATFNKEAIERTLQTLRSFAAEVKRQSAPGSGIIIPQTQVPRDLKVVK